MHNNEKKTGIINALAAYIIWGLAPIYFKAIDTISADEIMVHRIVWSCFFLIVLLMIRPKWRLLTNLLKKPIVVAKLAASACFLAFNWFLFIWAVNNDHLLDASLGYYINPLLNVALGMIFLSERLRKWQLIAVVLAVTGVLIQVITLGTVPIISLALASSFAIYGLLRKKLNIDSILGLFIESMLMLPIALVYWFYFIESPSGNLMNNNFSLNALLICAGLITTAPLLCFTAAAKRLTLSTVGFFQYIGPSIMFMLATFYYREAVVTEKLITFAFIWVALLIYSVDSLKFHRKKTSLKLEVNSK